MRARFLALLLALSPVVAMAQNVPAPPAPPVIPEIQVPEIRVPEIAVPDIRVPEIPQAPVAEIPPPIPFPDMTAEDGPPSTFAPFDLPPSRFEPLDEGGSFGPAETGSSFGQIEIAPELQEQTLEILSDFGAARQDSRLLVTLPGDVLFDFDKSDIRPDAEPVPERLATAFAALDGNAILILGHTDSKGADDYNQTLSERRADAVRDWLAGHDVRADAMTTEGRGEAEPVAPNQHPDGSDDPEGRQQNRRVEFIVTAN